MFKLKKQDAVKRDKPRNKPQSQDASIRHDVGIFGWWYNMNYGANLTYFSLYRAIQNMGYSTVVLWKGMANAKTPNNTATKFASRYYDVSPVYSHEDIGRLNEECGTYVLGSDQLWNPILEHVSGEEFFLSFADQGKGKVGYAQSVGDDRPLPASFAARYEALVQDFDGVSVREGYAEPLLAKAFGIEAPHVCDPIFLSERNVWDELIANADIKLPPRNTVNFLLDPDEEKVAYCNKVKAALDIDDAVYFTDLHYGTKGSEGFGNEKVEAGSSIENLVKAYSQADFVVTDSFHGTCLALIFNKPFISMANRKRGVGRFESLLKWAAKEERLVYDLSSPLPDGFADVDYAATNDIIASSRADGLAWLKKHLRGSCAAPRLLGHTPCVGCGACVSSCPTDALSLQPDNLGYYRAFLQPDKCIECRTCADVCPALAKPVKKKSSQPELYMFQAQSEELLESCTSGGVFPLLAQQIINQGGCVFGVEWTKDFRCRHSVADTMDGVRAFSKSKYFQSYMGDIDRQVKNRLAQGQKVLFSGCPCQVAGLYKYLDADPKNLITVDILCGNAPSTMFFQKYISEDFGDRLESYTFRDKAKGWNPDCISATVTGEGTLVRRGGKEDNYQRVYHNHTMVPKHCENCSYQRIPRFGDLTIGDFWGISHHKPGMDVSRGISAILCNSQKGAALFDSIPRDAYEVKESVPLEWLGGNGFAVTGENFKSAYRDGFYRHIADNTFSKTLQLMRETGLDRPFKDLRSPLDCDFGARRFTFESEFWEEDSLFGAEVLHVRMDNAGRGHFAILPLSRPLVAGKRYRFMVRFKAETDFGQINFHVADGQNPSQLQIVLAHKVDGDNKGQWVEVHVPFTCQNDNFDAFTIGASHFTGDKRYIMFDYIGVTELG